MDPIQSKIANHDPIFTENAAAMSALVADLKQRSAQVHLGGGPAVVEQHGKRGRLFVRDRIDRLIDPDSPFLERKVGVFRM